MRLLNQLIAGGRLSFLLFWAAAGSTPATTFLPSPPACPVYKLRSSATTSLSSVTSKFSSRLAATQRRRFKVGSCRPTYPEFPTPTLELKLTNCQLDLIHQSDATPPPALVSARMPNHPPKHSQYLRATQYLLLVIAFELTVRGQCDSSTMSAPHDERGNDLQPSDKFQRAIQLLEAHEAGQCYPS